MPTQVISKPQYSNHGKSRVAIVYLPTVAPNRFMHFAVAGEWSWKLRDAITDKFTSFGDTPRPASEVESLIAESMTPPFCNIKNAVWWKSTLEQMSQERFGPTYDGQTPPSEKFGKWRDL